MENLPFSTRRRRMGLTQAGLAGGLGLSRRQIQAYELGEEAPKRVVILAMIAIELHPELMDAEIGK